MRGMLLIVAGAAGAAVLVAGCRYPEPPFRPAVAAQAAVERDQQAIPELITMLYSDDALERMMAIRSLESITGHTFGYDHSARVAEREEAARRWAEWYRAQQVAPDG